MRSTDFRNSNSPPEPQPPETARESSSFAAARYLGGLRARSVSKSSIASMADLEQNENNKYGATDSPIARSSLG
jgi:hypothetical protein